MHHLTGRPAARLRLARRGLVRTGFAADLVVFDPATIHDTATFEHPQQQMRGIQHVLVNGEFALESGTATGVRAGRALRMDATREETR
ncbi:amidohydrolase family protein [Nocardia sp. NPDC057663]|uniref:amidohydrolase family protein n=1 Tax=Nocardia sp. NPDC057663 TaxID=3346201 RepID=UPI00366AC1BA